MQQAIEWPSRARSNKLPGSANSSHVRFNDGREVLVELATLAVLAGHASKRELSDAMAWARGNSLQLVNKWKELNP